MNVIERQVGITESIDYSKIDRYLDKAIYLDEDVIHIEYMDLPRNILQYKSVTLVDLFCFILHELKNELEEDVDSHVNELARKFKEQHLSYDQSLFNEERFGETVIILKDVLNYIDKTTAYKDNDYWQLYEAIESFLYGELDMNNPHKDGIFWGISNFYQIWEDMCNTYIFSHEDIYNVVYADTNIIPKRGKVNLNNGFINNFLLEFRKEKKIIRPDIVCLHNEDTIVYDYIEIDPLEDNGIIMKFRIDLKRSSKKNKKVYALVCKKFAYKASGSRIISNGKESKIFINYPKNIFEERLEKISNSVDTYVLIDWKYEKLSFFFVKSEKLNRDITKQLCYELCLQKEYDCRNTKSQFFSPSFITACEDKKNPFEIVRNDLFPRLKKSNIEVFKANFNTMQEAYLSND
ncbi:MAG: hypothetical protein D3903_06480 [Candidatus Electrothrix sp. GM3_4]|nr:hypothetical protein [Candidatus Electrothrix sp. GM3_4]